MAFSDSFNASTLDPRWTVDDRVGDCTVDTDSGNLRIALPAGSNHDSWGASREGCYVLQSHANVDFTLEIRILSDMPLVSQGVGIWIENADGTQWMRNEFAQLTAGKAGFAAGTTSGSSTSLRNSPYNFSVPIWFRVTRIGNSWQMFRSIDERDTWQNIGASYNFTLTVAKVGVYAYNHNSVEVNAPAFTALVDEFVSSIATVGETGTVGDTLTLSDSAAGAVTPPTPTPSMHPDNLPLVDDFDRSDQGPPPGTPWAATGIYDSGNTLRVVDGRLATQSSGGWSDGHLDTAFPRSGGVGARALVSETGGSTLFIWLANVVDDPEPTGYVVRHEGSNARLMRMDADVGVNLAEESVPYANGGEYAILMHPDGIISAWHRLPLGDWTKWAEVSETTYSGSFYPGLETPSNNWRVSTFHAGIPSGGGLVTTSTSDTIILGDSAVAESITSVGMSLDLLWSITTPVSPFVLYPDPGVYPDDNLFPGDSGLALLWEIEPASTHHQVSAADLFGVGEIIGIDGAFRPTLSDHIPLSDSAQVRTLTEVATGDSISLSDSIRAVGVIGVHVPSPILLSDSARAVFEGYILAQDSVSFVDGIMARFSIVGSTGDITTIEDGISATLFARSEPADSISIFDLPDSQGDLHEHAFDLVSLTLSILSSRGMFSEIGDSVSISDALVDQSNLGVSLYESLNIADGVVGWLGDEAPIYDKIAVDSHPILRADLLVGTNTSVYLVDSVEATETRGARFSDKITLVDHISPGRGTLTGSVSDTINIIAFNPFARFGKYVEFVDVDAQIEEGWGSNASIL